MKDDARTRILSVRLSAAEVERLAELAGEQPISELVRRRVFGEPSTSTLPGAGVDSRPAGTFSSSDKPPEIVAATEGGDSAQGLGLRDNRPGSRMTRGNGDSPVAEGEALRVGLLAELARMPLGVDANQIAAALAPIAVLGEDGVVRIEEEGSLIPVGDAVPQESLRPGGGSGSGSRAPKSLPSVGQTLTALEAAVGSSAYYEAHKSELAAIERRGGLDALSRVAANAVRKT